MLSALYDGLEVELLDQSYNNSDIKHRLHHSPSSERIMLLGHGSDIGLFSRSDDHSNFDRMIVSHQHAYYLRKHYGYIEAVCSIAILFAHKVGLHGLFSGMIISELSEASEYGIATTQEELDRENVKLANRLRTLFDNGTPLIEVPAKMAELDDTHTPLTLFNYANFYYL